MPVEKINWDKHDIVKCDDRGRATLGSEYANERVFVYVAELPDPEDLADETDTAKPCPACGGTGERETRECSICEGYGTVIVEETDG